MLPNKLAFVDIETTGTRTFYDRIIEIGIVRVQDNVVSSFHSLINPNSHIPTEIELLTGITTKQLENAPTFRELKEQILENLIDCFFVAHNVRFDYGFLRSEFSRENITFSSKQICTVRLSRILFPNYSHHNLDSIIKRFSIPCPIRHRALPDAKAIYFFYQKLLESVPPETLKQAIGKTLNKPSVPINMEHIDLEKLPESPGVYIFYGKTHLEKTKDVVPLYIGKSKNIKQRVLSHFASDIHSPLEMKISQQISHIETIQTAGELGALLLESKLIKTMLPLFNKKSRIKREIVQVKTKLSDKGYATCYLDSTTKISPKDIDSIIGIFKSKKQAKTFLSEIASEYQICEKLLGLEKTNSKQCFAYRLNRCKGACCGLEEPLSYNLRCQNAFNAFKIARWPFNSPIAIEEKSSPNRTEYFLVNEWCYFGSITVDEWGNKKTEVNSTISFDLDIYKILHQYLKNSLNKRSIKQISFKDLLQNSNYAETS